MRSHTRSQNKNNSSAFNIIKEKVETILGTIIDENIHLHVN